MHTNVWRYQMLIFWYFLFYCFSFQIFEKSSARNNCACLTMCEVILYKHFWFFLFCKYLKYPLQGAILKYVWGYRILIFLIFWFFVTIFFIFQIFDKFSARNNCACTPICVKLSDIDIFNLLIFLRAIFHFAIIWNILFKVQLWMHANMCEVIGYWYFGKYSLGISSLELASLFISELNLRIWLPWDLFKLRWKLMMVRNFFLA